MKREIKFRAWDKKSQRMFSVHSYEFNNSTAGEGQYVWRMRYEDEYENFRACALDVDEECDVMQFTGLKDKNGKDIYEGDLLQWDDEIGLSNTVYYEVFYDDGNGVNPNGFRVDRTHYKGTRCGGYIPLFHCASINKMVVVGNIYENPELLNS